MSTLVLIRICYSKPNLYYYYTNEFLFFSFFLPVCSRVLDLNFPRFIRLVMFPAHESMKLGLGECFKIICQSVRLVLVLFLFRKFMSWRLLSGRD